MNLYHLRYFLKLAELEHYTRAAEELMITQPSLSHAMAQLEDELGVNLFEKDGRNIVLTKYGRLFRNDVEKSLKVLDTGVKTLKMASTGEGHIEFGFLRTLGSDFVPERARQFLALVPDKSINFHFHTGITPDLIQGLKEKKFDLVLCSKVDNEPRIEFVPIGRQDLVLIVPKDHPLAEFDEVDLADTIQFPQVFFSKESGLRAIVDNLYNEIGATPEIAYEVVEDQVIAGLVAQNFGIAVCPNISTLSLLPVKVLTIKKPKWERNFYLAYQKNRYQAPVVKSFIEFLKKSV